MSIVTFAAIKSKVEELCTLPSTCPELKAVCREWLAAVGTDRQQEMNTKLLKEVGEDINTLMTSFRSLNLLQVRRSSVKKRQPSLQKRPTT